MNDYKAKILNIEDIGADGKKLIVEIDNPPAACGGQFAMLSTGRDDLILRRPLGIADIHDNRFTFILQVKGKGTKALASLTRGDVIDIIMPLGNGFSAEEAKSVAIVGGGYGVVPLLLTAKQLNCEKNIYLGFSTARAVMCEKEFATLGRLTLCTDDGSAGIKGFPSAALEADLLTKKPDIILCCGPEPLMRAVKAIVVKYGINTQLSLEQHMGCGIGACLVCTCRVAGENKRVCTDGPVFSGEEVFQ